MCTMVANIWEFGEGVDSARGVAAIIIVVTKSQNSSVAIVHATLRNGRQPMALFRLFRVQ